MIPKRIIQFWHDREAIPEVTRAAIDDTMALHPDYEHVLADDAFMRKHIAEHFNAATLQLYNRIRIPASRSDLARLMLLHSYGGTYLDCSLQLHKRLDSILREGDEIVLARRDDTSRFRDMPEKANIINGLVSAPPGSDFIHWCLLRVLSNLVDGDYNNKVALATGPQVINMGVYKLRDRHRFRYLSFAGLREEALTLTRQPGVTNNWLDSQGEGILDRDYLAANGRRIDRFWSLGSTFVHLSFSFLRMKS